MKYEIKLIQLHPMQFLVVNKINMSKLHPLQVVGRDIETQHQMD